jgi:hypothetical protein
MLLDSSFSLILERTWSPLEKTSTLSKTSSETEAALINDLIVWFNLCWFVCNKITHWLSLLEWFYLQCETGPKFFSTKSHLRFGDWLLPSCLLSHYGRETFQFAFLSSTGLELFSSEQTYLLVTLFEAKYSWFVKRFRFLLRFLMSWLLVYHSRHNLFSFKKKLFVSRETWTGSAMEQKVHWNWYLVLHQQKPFSYSFFISLVITRFFLFEKLHLAKRAKGYAWDCQRHWEVKDRRDRRVSLFLSLWSTFGSEVFCDIREQKSAFVSHLLCSLSFCLLFFLCSRHTSYWSLSSSPFMIQERFGKRLKENWKVKLNGERKCSFKRMQSQEEDFNQIFNLIFSFVLPPYLVLEKRSPHDQGMTWRLNLG